MEDKSNLVIKIIVAALLLGAIVLYTFSTESSKKKNVSIINETTSLTEESSSKNVEDESMESETTKDSGSNKETKVAKEQTNVSMVTSSNKEYEQKILSLSNTVSSLSRTIADLNETISQLEKKVESLEKDLNKLQRNNNVLNQLTSGRNRSSQEDSKSEDSKTSNSPYGEVSVTMKAKVENRYVQLEDIPNIGKGPTGIVIINVEVDFIGQVTKVSLNPNSTLKHEQVVDLCKESALKTMFSMNSAASNITRGTITYTFKEK